MITADRRRHGQRRQVGYGSTAYPTPSSSSARRDHLRIDQDRLQEGYETVTWSYTSDLSTARPTQPVFTTYTDDAGITHIVFGDNTSGRIPAQSTP